MGHKTKSRWNKRNEFGTTTMTAVTATTIHRKYYPKPVVLGTSPTYDFPVKRIKRTAGILLILLLIFWLLHAFKIF